MKTNGNKTNGNKPNARFKSAAENHKTNAKDYFLNRKGISEETIREVKSSRLKRAEKQVVTDEKDNKRLSEDRYLLIPYAYDEDFKGLAKFGACDFVIDGAIVVE